jgi:peptidyl-prolyl cis-trans isomerase B (cyclophilin B)
MAVWDTVVTTASAVFKMQENMSKFNIKQFAFSIVSLLIFATGFMHNAALAQGSNPIVQMQTTKGPIAIEVFINQAPNTARNFLELVDRGFYNGLTFHRIENWCIQGGDPAGNGTGNYTDPSSGQPRFINLEINPQLRHKPGVVAMARSDSPNSASCQFYITKAQTPFLDGKYAIFGRVANGMAGMHTVYAMELGDRILSAKIAGSEGQSNGAPRQSAPARDSGF